MNLELDQKVALVTGSDRRTGEVIARTLESEGATVVYHGNSELPEQNYAVAGDIASEQGCHQVLQQLAGLGLGVDILVNNFGSADFHRWQGAGEDKWLQMYQVNVLSAVRLIQGCTETMRERGWGRVVNLGTIGSHQPNSIMPGYYAAKGALATVAVSLMRELSGTGITVNTVSPGLIRTDQVEAGYRKRAKKKGLPEDWPSIERMIVEKDFPNACQRIAERQEVADLVAFLCSTRAGFINGQNIRIDGGAVIYV
jgi:NAD(P)-dependent dehydrogenase (short-subunit alcohol dehydrogenase family)